MPQILEPLADRTAPSPGTTAAVLALFAASGCAALIYQVVWFEQLSLAIGSSALSLAVLLATFMGGLGLGSLLASRGTGASYAPLRRYALVELGVGVLGLVTLAAIPLLAGAYTAWSGTGGLALRAAARRRGARAAAGDDAHGRNVADRRAMASAATDAAPRGSAGAMRPIPSAASRAASSPGSTCCACTTRTSQRSSRSR